MIAGPSNELVIAHQEEFLLPAPTHQPGAYGGGGRKGEGPDGGISGLVDSVVTILGSPQNISDLVVYLESL